MTNYQYPRDILPPRKVVAEIVPATTGGGRVITAVEQIVSYDAGYWQIDLDEIPVASRAQKIAWRALSAKLNGRLNIADVPIYTYDTAPWQLGPDGFPIRPANVLFSDFTEFSDDTTFADADIDATVSVGAAMGASQVTVVVTQGSALMAGMDFSVAGVSLERLLRISGVVSAATVLGATTYVLNITPPLREAITGGALANFTDPRCTCRLIDDQQMRSGADDYAARTLANISFVEAVNG